MSSQVGAPQVTLNDDPSLGDESVPAFLDAENDKAAALFGPEFVLLMTGVRVATLLGRRPGGATAPWWRLSPGGRPSSTSTPDNGLSAHHSITQNF